MFNPTHLKRLCNQYRLVPSKNYGQHFLLSDWPVKKMIEAADLQKSDTVVEIGPGFGVLTFALAERAERVIGLEIERRLESYWEEILREKVNDKMINDNIEIVYGNALKRLSSIIYHLSSYKVIANLPYQITSNVLRTLLELKNKPQSITIMVQKEVAERICAKPPDMSLLSVSVQYYGKPEIVAKVSKGNFWPAPKVDSAILNIEIKKLRNWEIGDNDFFRIVKAGFANKRKQLWGNLSKKFKIEDLRMKNIIKEITRNERIRAEELSVEQWREIARLSL